MSDVRLNRARILTTALAGLLVAGLMVGLTAAPASAKVPRKAFRYTAAIEPLAGYVGQSTCSPGAKKGTTAFANLLLRTYPRSRSLGISRACNVGGKSEHKEGRAFDWGMNVHDKGDRKAVQSLLSWLLKKDAFGNHHAMARRLGVQYIIWNRRIWGAYAASSGWRKYTGANPHTDHVHFSLSWAGARKKTSFWNPRSFPSSSGTAPNRPTKPAPKPDRPSVPDRPDRYDWPDPRPDERAKGTVIPEPRAPRRLAKAKPVLVETVKVSSRHRKGTRTRKALVRGRQYLLEVNGTYQYRRAKGNRADAECSTRKGAAWWQRERSLRSQQWYADHLDLYVDGNDLYAQSDDGSECDRGHAYRWVYEPGRTGRVPFAVWDPTGYKDNKGKLTVRVLDLGRRRDRMAWTVPARRAAGVTSPGLLRDGKEYLVTVSGTWRNGDGLTLDAECARYRGTWYRDVDYFDMSAGQWGYDSLSPRISGVRSLPVSGGEECDRGHRYTFVHRADGDSPLNVRVQDPRRFGDNRGALKVNVRPYAGPEPERPDEPTPERPAPEQPEPEAPPARPIATEDLRVDSRSPDRVSTQQSYPVGTKLRVTASGMYFMREGRDWVVADVECSVSHRDYRWRSQRYEGEFDGRRSPLGDLVVNGAIVDWRPGDREGSCDSENHVYTYDLTVSENGPVSFVVADDDYRDNRGVLQVRVEAR